jgi:hypothetical protein
MKPKKEKRKNTHPLKRSWLHEMSTPPHSTLIHEVVVHSSSKRRNETRKEDTETGALKNETKKGKRRTKDHKRFCLGRERQRNSR